MRHHRSACVAGLSKNIAELLLPLRPVLISPLSPTEAGDADDSWSAAEDLKGGPAIAGTAPFQQPDWIASPNLWPEVSTTALSDPDLDVPTSKAPAPTAFLFSQALSRAPSVALAHIRHIFEELNPDLHLCSLRVKQLYVAILEVQGTKEDLMQAVRVLSGFPIQSGRFALAETPLQDLTAAVAFVTKHCQGKNSQDERSNREHCTALWAELLHCTTGPQRVLVQYFKSQVFSPGCLIRGSAGTSDEESLPQILASVGIDGEGADTSKLLLKDAAPAISSLMKTARGQSNVLTLQRYG